MDHKELFHELLDKALGCLFIVFSAPLFFLAMILVKLDSRGPVFYVQERYGKDKRTFRIYKFRTMKVGAEKDRPVWGSESDPRSSRIGKFLRVSHIDELPQLFNVLLGQMSLVGPRPERPYFAEKFKNLVSGYDERFRVKPGITGLAQILGFRGDSSVDKRVQYDLTYIQNRSLFLNLKIIFLTPFAKPVVRQLEKQQKFSYDRFVSQKAEVFLSQNNPLEIPIANA